MTSLSIFEYLWRITETLHVPQRRSCTNKSLRYYSTFLSACL